ncbi:Lipid A export ATP-binding/permease protein MsbA [Thioalkalivibrio nitratireducens DSM 14787]|uniref:Lipid A export ATP-binding/permease protein MsbA n=1 Tax=Thioalkalivibrio nitratireducens (strain DSM 14787 / UNIQEM 213 / ALEN2) TaxID=1255043 RepID=L0DTL8_THIND|nr:ABC transporter ATP-binding protein [Thioalkalivibrio nitratireducens]AGA31716.1 Lipid A export ATP-binding/permease protein MsbA [Thioalkalivibrio nitratireducens DSM 14787]
MNDTVRQLWEILTPKARRRFFTVLLLVLAMTALETVGVVSIMPFLAVLGNPDLVTQQPQLAALYEWLGFETPVQFVVALGAASAAVVVIGSLFKSVTMHVLFRFAHLQRHEISTRLLQTYLQQPYAWFLGRNSADLSKSMLSEVDQLGNNLLLPVIQMIAHGMVILAMVLLLIVYDPLMALLAAGIIGSLYFTIYRIVRVRLGRIGRERREANAERFQAASEALGGIKAITLTGKVQTYLDRFRHPSRTYSRHLAANDTLGQVPLYLVEATGYAGLVALVLVLAWRGDNLGQILPVIGLYGFAAYRMLPAAQIVYRGFARLRFGAAALEHIHRDLHLPTRTHAPAPKPWIPQQHIRLAGVTYAYPSSEDRPVLRDIDLQIPVNHTIGIIGATGSGKSTLLDIILGLLEPTRGQVRIDDQPITPENLPAWHRAIGYVPQEIYLLDHTVAANIALGLLPEEIDRAALEAAARAAQIHDFIVNELPQGYETTVGERGIRLSGGQRQRIGIARALYHNPPVLILDEATSSLDVETEKEVQAAIDALQGQKTILIVAHRMSAVERCDRIVQLHDCRINSIQGFQTNEKPSLPLG